MSDVSILLKNQPKDHYCIVSRDSGSRRKLLPLCLTDGEPMFIEMPLRIFSSRDLAYAAAATGEEPFRLQCVSCFLTTARTHFDVDAVVLDGVHQCSVVAWRSPCATTATFTHGGRSFFLDGCLDSRAYWRPVTEKAVTRPKFLDCGAQNLDCIRWRECPRGFLYLDVDPVTLCRCWKDDSVPPDQGGCVVTFVVKGLSLYYADVSSECFDFCKTAESALKLPFSTAERVAKAIADIHLNYEGGMMANIPDCSVNVLDSEGRLVLKLTPP